MKKMIIIAGFAMLVACNSNEKPADAFGNFEAQEYTVSAEANGKIINCKSSEGDQVSVAGQLASVDTVDLNLRRLQLLSQREAIGAKAAPLEAQKRVYEQQIINLTNDKNRLVNMAVDGAATKKQLDDVDGAIRLVHRQIEAVDAQFSSLRSEVAAISSQIAQVTEAIKRCTVHSPVSGTVLEAYVKQGEFVNVGKPLFKIADLSVLDLRVFIAETQLASVKIGQQVSVYIDGDPINKPRTGEISWISSEAEFTPKTIQTREERVNLVYALKVTVNNDGALKIGMPGEIRL